MKNTGANTMEYETYLEHPEIEKLPGGVLEIPDNFFICPECKQVSREEPGLVNICDGCHYERRNEKVFVEVAIPAASTGRCSDCGEEGETTGHMSCQFPQDHF
jgi:recombinational DNA repair protein RecR